MDKIVSIIVPVYNVENYIRNCVDSVINQTYYRWELILVDDGSQDTSGKICDEYKAIDNRIKVIHQSNGGQANARNHALDICKGDYVTFLDSDDYLHKDALKTMLNLATSYDADMVQCGYKRGNAVHFPNVNYVDDAHLYDNHSIFLTRKANVIVWGKLIKRKVVIENRLREGKFYEDDFTTWKWYYRANRIVVTENFLYYYTDNPQSTMANHRRKPSFDFVEAYRERIRYFEKTQEKDLEDCSRLQLGKSIVLLYSNEALDSNERKTLKEVFGENMNGIKHSPYIPVFFRFLFKAFSFCPLITSAFVNSLSRIKQ